MADDEKVNLSHFELIRVLGTGGINKKLFIYIIYINFLFNKHQILAYGKVFLVRKNGGDDHEQLYAMKVLKKDTVVQKKKTAEHTTTERQVSQSC